jgi:putative membrane protein
MGRFAERSPELTAEMRSREPGGAGKIVHTERLDVARVGDVFRTEEVASGGNEGHFRQYRGSGWFSRYAPHLVPSSIRLILAWAINGAALWVANSLFSGVHIHGWWAYIIGAAVLGIANTVIKPVLALITLPLIILTLGLFLLVINIAMVALAAWIAPNFSINGFWTYVGTVVIIWLVNWVGHTFVDELEGSRSRPSLI